MSTKDLIVATENLRAVVSIFFTPGFLCRNRIKLLINENNILYLILLPSRTKC